MLSTIKPWFIKSAEEFEAGPCGHSCSHMSWSAEHEFNGKFESVWSCSHGIWRPLDEVDASAPHSGEDCPGNCLQHPLVVGAIVEMLLAMRLGSSWADIVEEDFAARRAAETPEERAARLAQEAVEEAERAAALVKFSTRRKVDKWCKDGCRKFRVARPCKYAKLFAENKCARCEGPCPGDVCPKPGCGEVKAGCWAHDVFMCCRGCPPPKEATVEEMQAGCPTCGGATDSCCIYVHPDEPQWEDCVAGRLLFDRDAQAFYLKGQPRPAPLNRFAAMAAGGGGGRPQERRQEDRRGGYQSHGRPPLHRQEERAASHREAGSYDAAGRGDRRPAPAARPAAPAPPRNTVKASRGAFAALDDDE